MIKTDVQCTIMRQKSNQNPKTIKGMTFHLKLRYVVILLQLKMTELFVTPVIATLQ